jgi:hypothetical protein
MGQFCKIDFLNICARTLNDNYLGTKEDLEASIQ